MCISPLSCYFKMCFESRGWTSPIFSTDTQVGFSEQCLENETCSSCGRFHASLPVQNTAKACQVQLTKAVLWHPFMSALLLRKSSCRLTWVLLPIPAMQEQQTGKDRNHISFLQWPRQLITPHLELLCCNVNAAESHKTKITSPVSAKRVFPNIANGILATWGRGIGGRTD